jgi:hypothetical protein
MAFCVPGESYLATLDALHGARNAIRMITCRQEGGVTNMAEAYGKITGKPGIAFVTRGPGACNGSIGVHTARSPAAGQPPSSGIWSSAAPTCRRRTSRGGRRWSWPPAAGVNTRPT